jgi:hypothetical protein
MRGPFVSPAEHPQGGRPRRREPDVDTFASAAAGLLPVAAVLAVLLLTWLGTAAFGNHFSERARRVPVGRDPVIPAQRHRAGHRPAGG